MKKIILAFLVATAGLNRVDLGTAQKPASVRKIGFLAFTEGPSGAKEVLRRSLAEVGYREGHNIVIEFRGAEERLKLIELTNELIQNKVEVIVASGGLAARSAKEASKTIPIVFAISSEPVAAGFVESIARPGRNMTGMSWLSFELVGKRVELLKEAAPRLSRIAILSNPQHAGEERELHETQKTAKALGITLDYYQTRTAAQFQTAFDNIARQ